MSSAYQWKDIYEPSFTPPTQSKQKLPSPPGFKKDTISATSKRSNAASPTVRNLTLEKLRSKRNWEFSYSPLKSLPMNLIMSYFSPNSLQLIPILMTLNLFLTPVKEIFSNLGKFDEFENVEQADLWIMKLIYIASWLCNVGVGVWKLNSMGLIPNTKSDWLSWEVAQTFIERS